MTEYIEREATLKDLELLAKYQHGERQQGILAVCETIKRRPAADVVEVCRCEDCDSTTGEINEIGCVYCDLHEGWFDKDAFCSYGERRAE